MNRREFLRKATGATAGMTAAGLAASAPVYNENLPPLPKLPPHTNKDRIAIIYNQPAHIIPDTAAVAAGAAAGLQLPNDINAARRAPTPRRKFLLAAAATFTASVPFIFGRAARAVNDEDTAIHHLTEELRQQGYKVTETDPLTFPAAMVKATEKRSPNAQTMIVINAHGSTKVIQGSKDFSGPEIQFIANTVELIPGHKLILSDSCEFPTAPFQDAELNGPVSLCLGQPGAHPRYSAKGRPMLTALRWGLRHPTDVIHGTREALQKLTPKTPILIKTAETAYRGKITIISNHPYTP